jgi:ribonuclease-3
LEKKLNKLYSEIEKILDYKFKDINLLDEALTHSSIKTNNKHKKVFNYERLEFLGDRILGFVISDLIFKKFPNFQEGDLSILFQKYTNTKFLSNVAISLNLNKFVVVQKGDALEKKDSIMSDLIESIIAAIYIDSNLDNAKFFIENKILNNSNIKNVVDKHPKSLLQEYSLRYYKKIPVYTVEEKTGPDHDPQFKVNVSINSHNYAFGEGSSTQKAQEEAAKNLLKMMEPKN